VDSDVSPWAPIKGETPIDPSGLKDRSIRTRADLNRAEAENIRKAHVKYLAGRPTPRMAPFDYTWLLRLHREMYCDVWKAEWVGQPRKVNLNLGQPWQQVPSLLMDLAGDLEEWNRSGTPHVEKAALLHYRAVWIHPFMNGNGRWARMAANIWLRLHRQPPIMWPEENIGMESPIRDEYVGTLRAADDGEMEGLIALHRRYSGEE
jgi:fido (protein-threonine AMPylation protein)